MWGSLPFREQWIVNFVDFLACILLASDWFKDNQLLSQLTHAHYRDTVPLKVDFKIASVDDQGFREFAVRDAWAVQDLTIPLKHLALRTKRDLWTHLRQVPSPEVERNKVSVFFGTNVQEAFIPLACEQALCLARKGKAKGRGGEPVDKHLRPLFRPL